MLGWMNESGNKGIIRQILNRARREAHTNHNKSSFGGKRFFSLSKFAKVLCTFFITAHRTASPGAARAGLTVGKPADAGSLPAAPTEQAKDQRQFS
jgi:hypothetical protein